MPPGTPYNSFIKPYPIRVDEFTDKKDNSLTIPALHLLTHTHSDHIVGLDAKGFAAQVICSRDAKEMLLRHETYHARYLREGEFLAQKKRTFDHLKPYLALQQTDGPIDYDLLRALPLQTPHKFEISHDEWVTITLIDANHCPGSVMFLVQGSKGSVLHTGDFRAEPVFVDSVLRNPVLQPFIPSDVLKDAGIQRLSDRQDVLEAIYLDTASMTNTIEIPSKLDATNGLIRLMKCYPPHTRFFINVWTWGYEDILKAITKSFGSKIHVDRYKHDVYVSLNDPELKDLATTDMKGTRFHACERFSRCEMVHYNDPGVVYVNPVNMSTFHYELYLESAMEALMSGELPTFLLVPLFRHSTLPELQRFVGIFRPERLVPNCLEPKLHGIDWACMPFMFGSRMAAGGEVRIREEMVASVPLDSLAAVQLEDELEDVERSNLEGGNETTALDSLADKFAPTLGSEKGLANVGKTIVRLKGFLPKGFGVLVDRLLRDAAEKALPKYYQDAEEDENESSDDEDDGGAMAEWLFMQSQSKIPEDNTTEVVDHAANAHSNPRSSISPKRKPRIYPSPRSERRERVLTEQTNLVKVEIVTACESASHRGDQQNHSQTESLGGDAKKKATYEHQAEIAELEKILHERSRMEAKLKIEPLSPPPTLKRPTSPTESLTAKRSCPRRDLPNVQPVSRSAMSNDIASTPATCAPSQHQDVSHSRGCIRPVKPLRKLGPSDAPDTRFRRAKANANDEMDWDRAKALQQLYICELRAGRKPKMPEMNCTAGRWGNWTRF